MSTVVEFHNYPQGICNICDGRLVVDAAGMDRVTAIGRRPNEIDPSNDRIGHVYCVRCGTLYHPGRAGLPVGEQI